MNNALLVRAEVRIGEVATHPKMVSRARSLVNKKLGAMLYTRGEIEEIALDAISETVVGLLQAIKSESSSLPLEVAVQPIPEKVVNHPVGKLIQTSINNYCNTRLRRWSVDQRSADEAQDESEASNLEDATRQDQAHPKKYGARSRVEIQAEQNDDSDFWDQHVNKSFGQDFLDTPKVMDMLSDKGLKDKQIQRILMFLDGMSFAEMSRSYGGVEGTYRHSVKNALEKIGLEHLYHSHQTFEE